MLDTSMDLQALHRAASAYYLDGLRQVEVAERMGISRPAVSKLLAEARRIGMVRFEVLDIPSVDLAELEERVQVRLGVGRVRIAAGDQVQGNYRGIAARLAEELVLLQLQPDDVLLVSSGKTTYAVSDMTGLPLVPGCTVVPTVGGLQEPEPSYQTNETVRRFAHRLGARPRFLFAPALTSPELWASLHSDPGFREVMDLWKGARAAIVGIGGPYRTRTSLTSVVPRREPMLNAAVGDICLHFFDAHGTMLAFPGSEFLVRVPVETLRSIPSTIALAAGREKAASICAGARAGLFTTLVTDVPTAEAVLDTTVSARG